MGSTSTLTINTNLSSLTCQKYLKSATKGMNSAMEKLSTGFKINSAKDDAAGYAVYTGMEAKVSGYDIIETNAQMGLDMLTTQEGVLDIINDYLQRIRDLTMQAANGTYGSASLNAIALEVTQRMDEINRLCKITDFNDTYLLDGSRTTDINLQVGLYSNQRCVITMDAFLFASAESSMIFGFSSQSDISKMDLTSVQAEEFIESFTEIFKDDDKKDEQKETMSLRTAMEYAELINNKVKEILQILDLLDENGVTYTFTDDYFEVSVDNRHYTITFNKR